MTSPALQISAIVLAAGASHRMGKSKQVMDVHGETFLERAIRTTASPLITKVIVVLGANSETHVKVTSQYPVDVTVNREWQEGMGTSVRQGVVHLCREDKKYDAVIILLCDQPLVTIAHIEKLIHEHKNTSAGIVASFYNGSPGVPALFSHRYFPELSRLKGSQGAKSIILNNPGDTRLVDFPEGATDIDTMEDYMRFLKSDES